MESFNMAQIITTIVFLASIATIAGLFLALFFAEKPKTIIK